MVTDCENKDDQYLIVTDQAGVLMQKKIVSCRASIRKICVNKDRSTCIPTKDPGGRRLTRRS